MLLDSCIGKAVIISSNQGNLDAEVNRFFSYTQSSFLYHYCLKQNISQLNYNMH
jgi:hypothetical protein